MTIQVFLFVGGENGIFSTFKYFLKVLKSPLKIGTFQNQKNEVEKMVWFFQVEKMGSPIHGRGRLRMRTVNQ